MFELPRISIYTAIIQSLGPHGGRVMGCNLNSTEICGKRMRIHVLNSLQIENASHRFPKDARNTNVVPS